MSQPYRWYQDNKELYDMIADRLDRTRTRYLDADARTRRRALSDSATYGLLTANTPLAQADRAFQIYCEHYPDLDPERLGDAFEEGGIGFHHNKARYICDNDADFGVFRTADGHLPDRPVDAQSTLMDAKGLGPAKSAFTLSMLGFTSCVCLDTHTCQRLGLDPGDYERHTAEQYQEMANDAFEQIPRLVDETSPFLAQWVVFDLNRDEIETHDLYYEHMNHVLTDE